MITLGKNEGAKVCTPDFSENSLEFIKKILPTIKINMENNRLTNFIQPPLLKLHFRSKFTHFTI